MDLSTGKIRPIYFKYLSAAFGSAMITSVYSIVDMAMVGQYQGPDVIFLRTVKCSNSSFLVYKTCSIVKL